MSLSLNDMPNEVLDKIISKLSLFVDGFLPYRLVSSTWNDAVCRHFRKIKHYYPIIVLWAVTEKSEQSNHLPELMAANVSLASSIYRFVFPHPIFSDMEKLPNLKAISINLTDCTKAEQDNFFTYLNTRPEITALELYIISLKTDVKLEHIQSIVVHNISLRTAVTSLFPPNHKFTQIWANDAINGVLLLKKMPDLQRFSQRIDSKIFAQDWLHQIGMTDRTDLSFPNLEIYGFHVNGIDPFKYVDNLIACCPNLKNIECSLSRIRASNSSQSTNLQTHSQVENLVIRGNYECSFEHILNIIGMFPALKNLKLMDMEEVGHDELTRVLDKLPNLSLLYLRRFEEFPREKINNSEERNIVQIDCAALKEDYRAKYNRELQIIRKNDSHYYAREISFRDGYDFLKNNFWPDSTPYLLTE